MLARCRGKWIWYQSPKVDAWAVFVLIYMIRCLALLYVVLCPLQIIIFLRKLCGLTFFLQIEQ